MSDGKSDDGAKQGRAASIQNIYLIFYFWKYLMQMFFSWKDSSPCLLPPPPSERWCQYFCCNFLALRGFLLEISLPSGLELVPALLCGRREWPQQCLGCWQVSPRDCSWSCQHRGALEGL